MSAFIATAIFSHTAESNIASTDDLKIISAIDSPVFIDTRDQQTCTQQSIENALCLNSSQLLYPNGTLASFRDINWLVGTYGLNSDSAAVVFGSEPVEIFFVAGILHLLGQHHVIVWQNDYQTLLQSNKPGGGKTRALLRSVYFAAAMRDEHIALDADVSDFFQLDSATRVSNIKPFQNKELLLYKQQNGAKQLLLAESPLEAAAHFAFVATNQPGINLKVHLDGLRGRTPESFGAPTASHFLNFRVLLAVFAILGVISCAIFMLSRASHKRRGKRLS